MPFFRNIRLDYMLQNPPAQKQTDILAGMPCYAAIETGFMNFMRHNYWFVFWWTICTHSGNKYNLN